MGWLQESSWNKKWGCLSKMEEEAFEKPLLKRQYHENCPGCKVDQAKELKKDVSFRNLSYIWLAVLCGSKHLNSVPKNSLVLVLFSAKVCWCCIILAFSYFLFEHVTWSSILYVLSVSNVILKRLQKSSKLKITPHFWFMTAIN